jgi:hypothetical protein
MKEIYYTPAVAKDAGLMREYITNRYGQTLKFGGSALTYFSGVKLCKKLAKKTGLTLETIIAEIISEIC